MVYEILSKMWSCSAKKNTCCANLLRVRKHQTKVIANMDQTPLPFALDDGKTYADKGSSEIWYQNLLVLIRGSALCNWQYLLMVYPAFVHLLYFVEKASELHAKSKKLRSAECRLHFNQKLGATNQWWKNGYRNNGETSLGNIFKAARFGNMFLKKIVVKPVYSTVAVCTL